MQHALSTDAVTAHKCADAELIYSPDQAARILGVCTATVRHWVADGRLRGHRAGPRLIRISASAVFEFLSVRHG